MALQNHRNLFERRIAGTLTNTVDGDLDLTGTSHHTIEGVGSSHTQVVMAMGRDDGLVDIVDMLLQVFDFLEILLWQAITRGVRDIDHRGSSLDDSLNDTSQVLVVRATGILAVELHIIDKALGILRSSHGTLQNLFTIGVELILNMSVRSTDTSVNTLVLSILQRIESNFDIALYSTGQRTNGRPRNGL